MVFERNDRSVVRLARLCRLQRLDTGPSTDCEVVRSP